MPENKEVVTSGPIIILMLFELFFSVALIIGLPYVVETIRDLGVINRQEIGFPFNSRWFYILLIPSSLYFLDILCCLALRWKINGRIGIIRHTVYLCGIWTSIVYISLYMVWLTP